jgi:hypothetical protein
MESPKDILEKAIQKAIDGGWRKGRETGTIIVHENDYFLTDISIGLNGYDVNTIIFNHDFAKALWGVRWDEDRGCKVHASVHSPDSMGDEYQDPWQYHLQQMVIAEDPIKYLGENL